jgi:hypothetical protein
MTKQLRALFLFLVPFFSGCGMLDTNPDGTIDFDAVALELELLEGDVHLAALLYAEADPERSAKIEELAGYVSGARAIVVARSQGIEDEVALAVQIELGMTIVEELLLMSTDDPEKQARIRLVAFAAEALLRRVDARTR